MYFNIEKTIKVPSLQDIPNRFRNSLLLKSLLRDVIDNFSQVYSDRYIGSRVRASKYFLTGTTLHLEICTNFRNWFTRQNSKREHFRYLFCY